jgi:hypothetical protein
MQKEKIGQNLQLLNERSEKMGKHILLFVLLIASIFSIIGCLFEGQIGNLRIINEAPPYQGKVRVEVSTSRVPSDADFLFEFQINTNNIGGLPDQDFLNEIKIKGAELGANILLFDCGSPGSVSENFCTVRGFRN